MPETIDEIERRVTAALSDEEILNIQDSYAQYALRPVSSSEKIDKIFAKLEESKELISAYKITLDNPNTLPQIRELVESQINMMFNSLR